jgi:hypothetical protein
MIPPLPPALVAASVPRILPLPRLPRRHSPTLLAPMTPELAARCHDGKGGGPNPHARFRLARAERAGPRLERSGTELSAARLSRARLDRATSCTRQHGEKPGEDFGVLLLARWMPAGRGWRCSGTTQPRFVDAPCSVAAMATRNCMGTPELHLPLSNGGITHLLRCVQELSAALPTELRFAEHTHYRRSDVSPGRIGRRMRETGGCARRVAPKNQVTGRFQSSGRCRHAALPLWAARRHANVLHFFGRAWQARRRRLPDMPASTRRPGSPALASTRPSRKSLLTAAQRPAPSAARAPAPRRRALKSTSYAARARQARASKRGPSQPKTRYFLPDTPTSPGENLPSEKKRTVNLFLPSLLWANSQLRRLLPSGACPMISRVARCRTGERGA